MTVHVSLVDAITAYVPGGSLLILENGKDTVFGYMPTYLPGVIKGR